MAIIALTPCNDGFHQHPVLPNGAGRTLTASVREERAAYEAPTPAHSMEDADDPAGLNTSPLVAILLIVAIAAAMMIVVLAIPALISSAGQLTQIIRSQT